MNISKSKLNHDLVNDIIFAFCIFICVIHFLFSFFSEAGTTTSFHFNPILTPSLKEMQLIFPVLRLSGSEQTQHMSWKARHTDNCVN